jgi:hypothetical protein
VEVEATTTDDEEETRGMRPTCWCYFQQMRGRREYFSEIVVPFFKIYQNSPMSPI